MAILLSLGNNWIESTSEKELTINNMKNSRIKIAIITNGQSNCGIYNHARATCSILKTSDKYEYEFVPVAGREEFLDWLQKSTADVLLWNYHQTILGWLDDELIRKIGLPQFMITGYDGVAIFKGILHYFVCDPTFVPHENYSPVARPLKHYPDVHYSPPGEVIKVGSFGFGQYTENFPYLVSMVNAQFRELVILNLHITYGACVDSTGALAREIANQCYATANSNVKLNIDHDFLDDDYSLVKKLNENDINVLCYSEMPGRGTSSCIDYLLSAKKPIALSSSDMFRHINYDHQLQYDSTSLKSILENGLAPLEVFYEMWSEKTFIHDYESIFNKKLGGDSIISFRVDKRNLSRALFRAPFAGMEKVKMSNSQAGQDLFVLAMLKGKTEGTYLEIGCHDPVYSSNTLILERDFGWHGVSIDIQSVVVQRFNSLRINQAVESDATQADYTFLLNQAGIFDTDIDYASVDCDPAQNTYKALKLLPLDTHRFAVITYEHDAYASGPEFKYRSREYLESRGYQLLISNISASGLDKDFEDWWIHPSLVDPAVVAKFQNLDGGAKSWLDCLFLN